MFFNTNVSKLSRNWTMMFFQLNITRFNFMRNALNVLKFEADQNLQKLRQPVDKEKWSTEPAVVNAFYNPNKNDIGVNTLEAARATLYMSVLFSSVSRGDSSTPFLQQALPQVFELRRHRGGYRARDHSRFRRQRYKAIYKYRLLSTNHWTPHHLWFFRSSVRQVRKHDAVVEQRHDPCLQREDPVHDRSVLEVQTRRGGVVREREDDAGGEYRRQRRVEAVVPGELCPRRTLKF